MKKNILKQFLIVALMGFVISFISSCNKKPEPTVNIGKVTGKVTDETGIAIKDVVVEISGMKTSTTTNEQGVFTMEKVTIEPHTITFSKDGYQKASSTITASKFDSRKIATINVQLVSAPGKISCLIIDARNHNAPLAGVVISVNGVESGTSDAEGKYEIKNLPLADYNLSFKKEKYAEVLRTVKMTDFSENLVALNIRMGGSELLPGLIVEDLMNADKWLYNEYRGGRNADAYPHWDWSTNYLCSYDFRGNVEEQNEGSTLRIRNDEANRANPENLDTFDSFVFGSKKITNENKIMSLRIRTHNADEASPAYFGVQVIDLSATNPKAEKVGTTKTYGSSDYADFDFDLTPYVGKEIIIAIGIYRKQTGDYWKQLVIRAIRFASVKVEGWNWLPGAEAVNGWKLPLEAVKSTMVQTKKSFTGISPIRGNRDNYILGYRSWREINHIAREWTLVPLFKDPEVFPSEGYIIKTRGNTPIDLKVPETYFYAKFAIGNGCNQLTLKNRTFGAHPAFFKLTVIKEDGTAKHISPKSHSASEASAATEGCWQFKHDQGDPGAPEKYATFVYDLSEFNGNNVVIALGIYKGETNTDENKMGIYGIDIN